MSRGSPSDPRISPIAQGVNQGIERRNVLDETLEAFGDNWEWGWDLRDTAEEIFRHMPEERPNAGPEDVSPWELRIGLSKFYVPPININVSQTYKAGALTGGALRQESAPKFNTGHKETVIAMTLYFPNYESIWGVEDQLLKLRFEQMAAIDGPSDSWDDRRNPQKMSSDAEIDRFMSTLRGLIAQFKYAPFLPIRNAYLNKVFGITGVTMKDLSISTVPNFPHCLAVQLIMYKFNHKTYLPMIDHFDQGIHWGRFRSYAGRAVGRLAQASRPIRSWEEHNQITNSNIDVGAIEPSLVRASDYIARNQRDQIGSQQVFRRLSAAEVDDFELYFPLHTPQRVDIPSTAFIEDRFDTGSSGFIPEPWWQSTLSRLGLNLDSNPEARYESVRRSAEEMGNTYISPGNTGLSALTSWLKSYGYTIENMSASVMNQFITEHLSNKMHPNHPSYAAEVSELRQMWFFYMYRSMLEDPYLASMLAMQDRRARQLTINEWELPMFALDLDKNAYKVTGISISTGNNIARHQLQMEDEPTHQHIGGADDRLDIAMIFTGPHAERELTRLRMMMDQIGGLARLEQGHGVLGFLGIKSALASLVGMRYVIPVGFEVETIPNQPGSYSVNLSFIDFDIFQQKREQLDPSQQAYVARQFGKQNPFLRIKQMWGAFNGHPDLPLGVHDSSGKLVGHLDPDYYFKSFQVIDDDIVDPGPTTGSSADAAPDVWSGEEGTYNAARGWRPSDRTEDNDAMSLIAGAIPVRVNLPQVEDRDGNVISPAIDIDPDEDNTIHFLEDGHYIDDESAEGYVFGDGGSAATLGAPPMIEGMSPAMEHSNPLLFDGDNAAAQFYAITNDMQYRDNSGRMIRAFPTYMLWLIDEAGFGYGMRFFDNFYGLQSVIDFSVVQSDQPLNDTLVLRVSNLYSKLSTKFHDYLNEDGETDVTARIINSFTQKYHRMLTGQGDYIADLDTVELKPGIRVHLRAGYSANPNKLETIFNGTITEVEEGEVMTIVAQSDAMELSALVDTESEDSHSGKVDGSLRGLYLSEPRDLMVTLLSEGASRVREFLAWATRGDVFSENRYGIKHFGNILYTYMDGEERRLDGVKRDTIASIFTQYDEEMEEAITEADESMDQYEGSISGAEYGRSHVIRELIRTMWVNRHSTRDMEIFKRNIYPGNGIGIGQYLGGDLGDIGLSHVLNSAEGDAESASIDEAVFGALYAATGSQGRATDDSGGSGSPAAERPAEDSLRGAATGAGRRNGSASLTEEGLRGAVTGSVAYRPYQGGNKLMPGIRNFLEIMGITNPQDEDGPFDEVAFRASTYMQTVWDMFEVCAALLPNYIVAIRPFEDRSTVFYGKPHWLYTSGVIPLTAGAFYSDSVAFMEPDEETAKLRDDIVSILLNNDEVNDLENFKNEISFWDAEGLEKPTSTTIVARTWDPTTGTWTHGSSVSDAEGADLAAEAAYAAGFRGDELVTMVAIAGAESGWNYSLNNAGMNSDGTTDYGMWQINEGAHGDWVDFSRVYEPFYNAEVAYALVLRKKAANLPIYGDWAVHEHYLHTSHQQATWRNFLPQAEEAVSRFRAGMGSSGSPVEERPTAAEVRGDDGTLSDLWGIITGSDDIDEALDELGRWQSDAGTNVADWASEFISDIASVQDLDDAEVLLERIADGARGSLPGISSDAAANELLGQVFGDRPQEYMEVFYKVIGATKGDHQIPGITDEFLSSFLEDDLFIDAFKSSRLVAALDEERKQQVADEVAEEVGQLFIDWVKDNPYAFGWVVRTASARGNPITGSIANPLSSRNWNFHSTYMAFVAFCGYGVRAAEEYMADNLDAGRRNAAIGSSLWNIVTDSEFRKESGGFTSQVMGLPGEFMAGVVNLVRLSLLTMTQGLSMSLDMQKRSNVLNRMLNDSIYFNAGRDEDGNISHELLHAADNPFTREYGEPVVEIREPFSRMHTLGSFQHIIHNGIIQSLDEVSTVVTATSNDGEVVTVHFDKGMSSERQVERTIDTGIYWDEPKGWFGLNKLSKPIQSLRALHRRLGWGRANEMISSEISAKRIALAHLKKSLETLYRGELTIVGDPSIRPHDMIYMMDVYCQPPGTMVRVAERGGGSGGESIVTDVPIEKLSEGQRVVSMTSNGTIHRRGKEITGISVNHFEGNLVKVTSSSGLVSRYTPGHRCIVKFGDALAGKWVVYLMEKGGKYRIGITSGLRTTSRDGKAEMTLGLSQRMRAERADRGWILSVHDTKDDAAIAEVVNSVRFGIPQTLFVGDVCDKVWAQLINEQGLAQIHLKARMCLESYGLDIRYPLRSNGQMSSVAKTSETYAANLLDGMLMRREDGLWEPITVSYDPYSGPVYSMDVADDETYVADGLFTHNSRMYGFITARQVVHHMTPEMGFITQVTPGLPVHVNDPARWSIMARWKGSLAAHSVRETARRVLVDNERMASNLMDQYSQHNNMSSRDMTIDDLVEIFDTQIQGSLQYTEGIGSLIGDQLSAAASGGAVTRNLAEFGLVNPLTGGIRQIAERWGPFRWFRDNMLDQHGCYVDFLTKNGRPMDGNLSYSQGTAVGHPRERALIIGGLKLLDVPVVGPGGSRIIPTEQVIPNIRWRETDGLTNHAKQISLFHDATISKVRDLAFAGEFLSNFASDVYWARITRVIDADTFEVSILGHAPNGVYQRNTSLSIGTGERIDQLRLFGSDAAEDDYMNTSAEVRNARLEAGDLGVRATEWVKQKLNSPEVNNLVAIRVVQPNATGAYDRGLGYVFWNAPGGYWDEDDPTNQQRRREYLLNAAGRIPVKAWDSYTEDGRPHTLDWELITRGFGHVYSNDLRAVQPQRGARGG